VRGSVLRHSLLILLLTCGLLFLRIHPPSLCWSSFLVSLIIIIFCNRSSLQWKDPTSVLCVRSVRGPWRGEQTVIVT
jgi:hypothetical protein